MCLIQPKEDKTTKSYTQPRDRNASKNKIQDISDEEMKKLIHGFEPTPIIDYYKKPYKTIFIVKCK